MAESKKSSKKNTSAKKKTAKKETGSKKAPKVETKYENEIPASTIVACISILAFFLFLVISINPDGAILKVLFSLVRGLIGQAGFYFAMPAFLYLFLINISRHKDDAAMRSICIGLFVLCCGSMYHLIVQTQGSASGFGIFKDLYLGGVNGITGGVICGGIAMILVWACGRTISLALVGAAAVLTLLASMQITIPSILRAIANRPKDDWQEEVYIEPAAAVVNHIANKNIERKRQRRQRMEQENASIVENVAARQHSVQALPPEPVKKQKSAPQIQEAKPASLPEKTYNPTPANAARMMNTIDLDVNAPLSGTVRHKLPAKTVQKPTAKAAESVAVEVDNIFDDMPVSRMPAFDPTDIPVQTVQETDKERIPEPPKPVKPAAPKTPATEKQGKVSTKESEESAQQVAVEIAQAQNVQKSDYCFPPIDLLKRPTGSVADGTEEMRENSRRLNETLASFKIDAHITNVTRGPSVTRYEVELDKGVRLNKLTGCADDIALSLGASGVRIAAVPGKISIVGIEVPNQAVTMVSLREVIDSGEFNKSKSKSSFAVGKDISGACIVGNIAKMPHMLIAGTTGSGKSVCMNSIIISLLYKSGPEDVKLIMVDPKMVELGIYNGIPQLLIPVVTDPKKAAGSLQWAVTEMLRRYKLMSDVGARELESYNSIITAEEGGQKLPQIVVIIDELADLMMVAAKEVEDSICRIAQMGRAAGMHLIIATQRPSADVITGLMKANIPSRIAFSVASAMESRIILDTQGAEKLVGKGDMLYAPIGCKPLRVQGCFVTDREVEAVATYVKDNYSADYNQEVLEEIEKKAQQAGKSKPTAADAEPTDEELEGDEMLPAAVDVILETGQASVSMLQRRLKLGYARAARIVDEMEEKGIVGPFQGSKPRAILVTKEQWAAMHGGIAAIASDDEEDMPIPEEVE